MKKARRMTNRIFSLFLALVMLCTISDVTAFAQTADTSAPQVQELDSDQYQSLNPQYDSETDTTDWHYIYFGSCPQTEVRDADLITRLDEIASTADWDEEWGKLCDVTLDGEQYRFLSGVEKWYKWKPMKWRVLQAEEDTLFVLADAPVSMQPYGRLNDVMESPARWSDAEVQKYLNNRFLNKAFSGEEKKAIVPTPILTTIIDEEGEYPVVSRDYNVFLLSYPEVRNSEYGFNKDSKAASPSRYITENDYVTKLYDYYRDVIGIDTDDLLWDGWWLRKNQSDEDGGSAGIVGADFIPDKTLYNTRLGSVVDKGAMASMAPAVKVTNYESSVAYVVPALRISKNSSSWSVVPDDVGVDPEVTQAVENAISKLDGYSKENYSDDNWAKVQEIIDLAKEELKRADNLEDVANILNDAIYEIEKISAEGGETPDPDPDPTPDPDPEPEPDLYPLLPEDVSEALRNRTFTKIDGGKQAMYSEDHDLTIEVFAYTTCPYSGSALEYLQALELPEDKVDIFSIELYIQDKDKMRAWAEQWRLDTQKITLCYNTAAPVQVGSSYETVARNDLRKYSTYCLDGKTEAGVVLATPTYVFRDNTGKLLKVVSGFKNTEALTEILTSIGYGNLIPEDKRPMEAEVDVTYGQTEARQMLSRINEFRTGDGAWEWNKTDTEKVTHTDLGELTYDYELEKAAMQRAADLVAAYSHTRPDNTSCFTAYSSAFNNTSRGENIAIGYRTEEAVFEGWKEEDEPYSGQGHRRNMLSETYQAVGIAHVVYNGCHYWVQEFSSGVVGGEETPANDSQTPVKVKIAKDNITTQKLKSDADEIQLKAGQSQELPQVNTEIRTNLTWEYGPSLEFPVTAEWSVSSGEDVVRISEGALYALKEGNATVTASYNGKTTEIRVIVAPGLTTEGLQETLQDYESKLADYGETEKAELQALLETIKGEAEAALAEGDLEAAEAALAKMEAALEAKVAGKKEEAKQELKELKGSIAADDELDDDQRAEIEDVLNKAEEAIDNAKDATAVKEALADAQEQVEEIRNMSPELRQERKKAQQQISAWNEADFLAKYGETEQAKIKEIADKLAADMKGKTEPSQIGELLSKAQTEVEAIKTEEQKASEKALSQTRSDALEKLDELLKKIPEYPVKEQGKLKDAVEAAKAEIEAAKDAKAIEDALAKVNAVFQETPTDGTGTGDSTGTGDKTPAASLSLDKTQVTLYTGKASNSVTIKPTVTGSSQTVTWKTDKPKVATVKNGKITAVGKGTATITATANGISKTVKVTVKNPTLAIKQGSKKFTKSKLTVKKNKKVVLTVTVTPNKSGISIAKLTAKQKKIASVTLKKGKITIKGKKKGSFTLQIKSGKATKKIKITVK